MNANGQPVDSNGDGIPDYLTDTNGNGSGPWMPSPVITIQPTNQVVIQGTNASLSVTVTSLVPPNYQWYFNSNSLAGATNSSLIIANVQPTNVGYYFVKVGNPAGGAISSNALLTVIVPPVIVQQPTNQTVMQGSNVVFGVIATGTSPLSYQWYLNGTILSGATNGSLTVANTQLSNDGSYSVTITNAAGGITSSNGMLTVVLPPAILLPPSSLPAIQGSNVAFNVTASSIMPVSYQWFFNGTNLLVGARNATLILTNIQPKNAGYYSVRVTNLAGSVTCSNAYLTVLVPPLILTPPASQVAVLGSNVILTVVATANWPLNYQWRFNGTNILRATNATLTLTNVQLVNAGSYSVVVSNMAGTVVSSPALLNVLFPVVTVTPTNQMVVSGTSVSFHASVFGTPSAYQWQKNGFNLVDGEKVNGSSSATLNLTGVSGLEAGNFTDNGNYSVLVLFPGGIVVSNSATLEVATTSPAVKTKSTSVVSLK